MPVPLLAPLLGSLIASSMPAIGAGVSTALGAGAASGLGSLLAKAAPSAIGAGIGTLAAGGNAGEALANAAMFGASGAALSNLSGSGVEGQSPMQALQSAGEMMMQEPAAAPMQAPQVMPGRPVNAAPNPMMTLPQPQPGPALPYPVALPAGFAQPMMPTVVSPSVGSYPMGGIASAAMQNALRPLMMANGGYVEGPGTGRSDSIPARIFQDGVPVQEARLSDGEFVMTERAVRGAGNGDRSKGAAKMYRMMREFERGGRV